MPLAQIREFVETLKQSGLLEREQLATVRDTVSRETEPTELAGDLVERGWITFWQAQQLLAGVSAFYLGKYKLLQKLGEGGMGAVYQAEQARIKRLVALKVLNQRKMHNPAAIKRFQREVQALAALNHPHIITAYDADRVENTFFLVMEYLEGRDLGRWLVDHRQLPIDWACECVRQAALGLQHAFERGLVHRDIKPSNLLVCAGHSREPPHLKILDLGLARLKNNEAEDKLTRTDEIMGTPDYIAPEQAGDTSSAETQADIYSLGCVLFELLTGQVPFTGRNVMEKLMARGLRPAPLASGLRAEIPAKLDQVVAKMLARNPADRYQTPQEVATAIEPFAWQASHSTQLELPRRLNESLSREAAMDASLEQIRHRLASEADSESSDLEEAESFVETNGHSDSSLDALMDAVVTVSDQESETTASGPDPAQINHFDPPSELVDISAEKSDSSLVELPSDFEAEAEPPLSHPEKSNSSKWLLLGFVAILPLGILGWVGPSLAKSVLVLDWPAEERSEARLQVDGTSVEFPPEGPIEISIESGSHRIIIQRRGFQTYDTTIEASFAQRVTIQPVWRPVNSSQSIREPLGEMSAQPGWQRYREAVQERQKEDSQARQAAWSEVSERASQAAKLSWDQPLVTKVYQELHAFLAKYPGTAEANQATELLAELPSPLDTMKPQSLSNIWPIVEEKAGVIAVLGQAMPHWGEIRALAFSHDQEKLASGGEGGLVHVWNAHTGEHLRAFQEHDGRINCLEFHPGDQLLAAAGNDGNVVIWNLADPKDRTTFACHASVRCLDISPDGNWLACGLANHSVRLYDLRTNERQNLGQGHWNEVSAVQFSRDSQYLLSAGTDKLLFCWDVQSGKRVRRYESPSIPFGFIECSDDGKTFFATTKHLRQYTYRFDSEESLNRRQLPFLESEMLLRTGAQQLCVITAENETPTTPLRGDDPSPVITHIPMPFDPKSIDLGVVSNDKRLVAISLKEDNNLLVYSVEERTARHCGPSTNSTLHAAALIGFGDQAISGHDSGEMRLWEVATQQYQLLQTGHEKRVCCLAVSPDGSWFVAGSSGGTLSFHRKSNRWQAEMLEGHLSRLNDIAISPTGEYWASTDIAGVTKVWNGNSPEMVDQISLENSQSVSTLTFSPDGQLLVMATKQKLLYGYSVTLQEIPFGLANAGDELQGLCFSCDGATLFGVGSEWHALRRWDWQAGEGLERTHLDQRQTLSLVASPRGILAAGTDGTVGLWVGESKKQPEVRWSLGPPYGNLTHLSLNANGRYASVVGSNGLIYVFRLPEASIE